MKRRLRHALLWILVVAAAGTMTWRRLSAGDRDEAAFTVPESARARPVVVLDKDHWTAFRIPSSATRIKLLSRANLAGEVPELADREFPYRIDYQLESLTGAVISQGSFSLRTQLIPMQDAAGSPRGAAVVRNDDLKPASAKASTVEVASDDILLLKLRARGFDAPVTDVSVRAFLRQMVPDRKLAYQWSRLSATARDRLAAPRIHALVDLRPEERRATLRNRWKPLGAQGVVGRDYHERIMYLRDDLDPVKRQLVEPLGIGEIRCHQARRAIIGIPAPGGRVRLEFRRLEDGQLASATIRHFGESIHERSWHVQVLGEEFSEFSAPFAPGMLQIESPVGVAIRPFWKADGQPEQLLEPDPTISRVWHAGPQESLTFALGGDRRHGGFFRLSARPEDETATTLRYELLGADGAVVHEGERDVPAAPSLYDLLLTPDGEAPVSDPVEVMLELPAGVESLRFRANKGILLAGYTRPAALQHRTRVPGDYDRALPDPDRLPVWFGIRPEDADDLIRAHRSFLVHTQVRPPEDDADILAGKYQWEDYQPLEGARGQYLLGERDPASPSRDEALPSLFMPVTVGAPQPLALANPPGLDLPSRRLAFVRDGNAPVAVRVLVDGEVLLERQLVTERGELLLPPIQPDSARILIESGADDMRCFLNYVQPDKATVLKRLAQRVRPGTELVYHCDKAGQEDELLTGMFFAPPGPGGETEIHVSIRPGEGGAFLSGAESLTLRDRVYFVTPDQERRTPVLGGDLPAVDGGRRFFIPFGSDLKPGTYEVTITLRYGGDGYLTLSKVTGGDYSDARFFREASR